MCRQREGTSRACDEQDRHGKRVVDSAQARNLGRAWQELDDLESTSQERVALHPRLSSPYARPSPVARLLVEKANSCNVWTLTRNVYRCTECRIGLCRFGLRSTKYPKGTIREFLSLLELLSQADDKLLTGLAMLHARSPQEVQYYFTAPLSEFQ